MKLQDLRGHNLDLIIPISLIVLAELLIFFNHMQAGVVVHAFNLGMLILSSIYVENRLYTSLMLLPLFRLLNVAMPVFFNLTLYTYPLVYAPMFIPIYFIMKERMFSSAEAGITLKSFWIYLPLAFAVGFAVGWGEYRVLQPGIILPGLTLDNLLTLSIIMIVFVGFVEEFVFRSALQTVLAERMGPLGGLFSASLIFGFMHSGYHIPMEVVYVTFAGIAFGLLFWATKSLPIISIAHGVTNVELFALVPFFPGHTVYLIAASVLIFLGAAYWGNKLPDRAAIRQWLREKGQV
jgi:membrane protease YdiL (CAAX protease family)